MAAKQYRRKDLKKDEFVSTTTRVLRWLMQRRRRIGWGLLIAIGIASVLAGVWMYRARQEEKAARQLGVALQIYHSPEEDASTAGASGNPAAAGDGATAAGSRSSAAVSDEHGGAGHRHFETAEARYEAARDALRPIVEQFGGYRSGRVAAFYLGLCEARLGNPEAAIESLERATESSKSLIAATARYRLGQLYLDRGRPDDAVATFEKLVEANTDYFPAGEALMAKARAHEAADDRKAALATYRRVVENHGESVFASEARSRVDELSAQLGLDPDVESS